MSPQVTNGRSSHSAARQQRRKGVTNSVKVNRQNSKKIKQEKALKTIDYQHKERRVQFNEKELIRTAKQRTEEVLEADYESTQIVNRKARSLSKSDN